MLQVMVILKIHKLNFLIYWDMRKRRKCYCQIIDHLYCVVINSFLVTHMTHMNSQLHIVLLLCLQFGSNKFVESFETVIRIVDIIKMLFFMRRISLCKSQTLISQNMNIYIRYWSLSINTLSKYEYLYKIEWF